MRRLLRALLGSHERGQALILFAAGLAALGGFVGMSIDVGQLVATKTDLQKIADAAVLAGAQDLPNASAATASAGDYITRNGSATCDPTCVTISSTSSANDTIAVTAMRRVNYSFLRLIGLSGSNVTAKAKVTSIVVTGYAFDDEDVFPYGVWGGNPGAPAHCPYGQCVGDQATFRDNQYRNDVEPNFHNNPNWNVNSDTFKGYFHHGTGVTQIDPNTWQTFSNGGNAIGSEPVEALHEHYLSGRPIIVPVIGGARDCGGATGISCAGGDIQFKIVAWVALRLTVDPLNAPASWAWQGTIVGNYATSTGSTSGNSQPPPELATRTITLVE